MGTTAQKLQKILDTKAALKNAINERGGTITDDTPFDEYPIQVSNIPSSPSFTDPNITFRSSVLDNDMILRIDTYNSDIEDNVLYLYKITAAYTISSTPTGTDIRNKVADLYVCMVFVIDTAHITCLPITNPSSDGPISLRSTSADTNVDSYDAELTFFTSSSSRGYARSLTLNSSELIYTKIL